MRNAFPTRTRESVRFALRIDFIVIKGQIIGKLSDNGGTERSEGFFNETVDSKRHARHIDIRYRNRYDDTSLTYPSFLFGGYARKRDQVQAGIVARIGIKDSRSLSRARL